MAEFLYAVNQYFVFRMESIPELEPFNTEESPVEEKAAKRKESNDDLLPETKKLRGIKCALVAPAKKDKTIARYLVTRILQHDFLPECNKVNVWQLKHPEDPRFKYEQLTPKQQSKVEKLFDEIMKTPNQKAIKFFDDELGFLSQGGKDCGPFGTKGLCELDYLLETIAWRLSKDDTQVDRDFPDQDYYTDDVFKPVNFIDGTVAFLDFVD